MIKLAVPYYSQLGDGAEYYVNDCLAANFRMVWGYSQLMQHKQDIPGITVRHFAEKFLTDRLDLGSILDVYKLSGYYAINYKPISKYLTIDNIKNELQDGWPVICLVLYNHLRDIRQIGHFVLAVGCDDENHTMYYHDPYYDCDEKEILPCGAYRSVSYVKFDKALNPGSNKYFSNPYQGLIHA